MAKSKKQLRKQRLRQKPRRYQGDWGYFLFQKSGVSVVYAANTNEDGSVDAALFGIDDWVHGLIICCGRSFGAKESFDEFMENRSDTIKPAKKIMCQQEVAYGLRIRTNAKAELPEEFSKWRHIVDPLDSVNLPASIYLCPGCGRGLPDEYVEMITENVDNRQMVLYMVCDRCKEQRLGREGAYQASTKHSHVLSAVEEIDEFSVTWDQEMARNLIETPIPESISEGVEELIRQDGPMKAACFAIEIHIVAATAPNDIIEDKHVFEALNSILYDRDWEEDSGLDIVGFLVEGIEKGIDVYERAMLLHGESGSHLRAALRETAESVQRHQSNKDKRSYINFIKKFIPF